MNTSLVISYCCLGITCLSCLCSPPYDLFIFLALITTFVYAVLGALKVGLTRSELQAVIPEDNINWTGEIDKYLALTSNLLPLFVLPCLTASMWLNQDYVSSHYSLLHFILALAASAGAVFQKVPKSAIDATVVCTSTSLLLVSLATHNVYAVYADIYFIIAYFCTHHIQRSIESYSPVDDLYQYFLSVFVAFTIKSAHVSIRKHNRLARAAKILKSGKLSKLLKITEISKHAAIAGSAQLVHAVNVAKIAGLKNLGSMGAIAEYASAVANAVASLLNLNDGLIDKFIYLVETFLDVMSDIYQQLRTCYLGKTFFGFTGNYYEQLIRTGMQHLCKLQKYRCW